MPKNSNWRSIFYISIVLFTPLLSAKSYVNKHVKSQDALTISSNLAQSSALDINSTSSHYKRLPYNKLYSSKNIKSYAILCCTYK